MQVVGFDDRSTGRGTFGGTFGARHRNQWGLYMCDSTATRPSSQITLGRLVIHVFFVIFACRIMSEEEQDPVSSTTQRSGNIGMYCLGLEY